jgi:hypothetical protein
MGHSNFLHAWIRLTGCQGLPSTLAPIVTEISSAPATLASPCDAAQQTYKDAESSNAGGNATHSLLLIAVQCLKVSLAPQQARTGVTGRQDDQVGGADLQGVNSAE